MCGVSASNAPRMTTVSTSSFSAIPSSSAQNERHRMLGSTPCISTMSRSLPGGRQCETRIDGQTNSLVTPSSCRITGRLTW